MCVCSEPLVRRGFQALQLVISDYLPALPTSEVPLCIVVATKFALQQVDINISLTAVGLLWSVADHLFHSQGAEAAAPGHKPGSKTPSLPSDIVANIPNVAVPPILTPFLKSFQSPTPQLANRLWLLLFASLSDLCADPRAAVRKSASQTLFSTVTAHGTLLEDRSWGVVLWMVSAGDRPAYTVTNSLPNPPSLDSSSLGPTLTWFPLTGAVPAAGAGSRADSVGLHTGPARLLPHPPHTQHCSEAVGGVSGEALKRKGCVPTL